MTVRELIDKLQAQDPDAQVVLLDRYGVREADHLDVLTAETDADGNSLNEIEPGQVALTLE